MRDSLKRIEDGHDVGLVLLAAIREAYGRGQRDSSEPFSAEPTPVRNLWQEDPPRPSMRPTAPPRGPTGTLPAMPAPPSTPPPPWPPRLPGGVGRKR